VPPPTLKRTSLFESHRQLGAKLVPFAGWEMPVEYDTRVRAEHVAVRTAAGIFDVSHMGEVECSGPGAEAFLQRVLSNDVSKLTIGGAQYALMCNDDGGVLDDLFTYRLAPDRYLTVTNAANHERDVAWMREHAADYEVEIADARDDYAMLAVQGPRARDVAGTFVQIGQRIPEAHGVLLGATRDLGTAREQIDRVAPGGLLSPLRQRPEHRPWADRGRSRLGLQGGHAVHRLRCRTRRARGRPSGEARAVQADGPGHRAPGQPRRRRR